LESSEFIVAKFIEYACFEDHVAKRAKRRGSKHQKQWDRQKIEVHRVVETKMQDRHEPSGQSATWTGNMQEVLDRTNIKIADRQHKEYGASAHDPF
jgi:hypothetical protein